MQLLYKIKKIVKMSNKIRFPESFNKKAHEIIKDCTHWEFENYNCKISIIGGGYGVYGTGVTTFEFYDFADDKVIPYLTIDEINELLKKYDL